MVLNEQRETEDLGVPSCYTMGSCYALWYVMNSIFSVLHVETHTHILVRRVKIVQNGFCDL